MRKTHCVAIGLTTLTLVGFAPEQLMALVVAIVAGMMVLLIDSLIR